LVRRPEQEILGDRDRVNLDIERAAEMPSAQCFLDRNQPSPAIDVPCARLRARQRVAHGAAR
jgi:hypothetical protein